MRNIPIPGASNFSVIFKLSSFTGLILVFTLITSCEDIIDSIRGNGNLETVTFEIDEPFNELRIQSGFQFDYVFKKDTLPYEIDVTIDGNILSLMRVYVEGDELIIGPEKNIKSATKRKLVIMGPALEEIDLSGGSKGKLPSLAVNENHFDMHLSGGSKLKITGKTRNLEINGSGGSVLDGKGFEAEEADVQLSGGSEGSARVINNLNANLSEGSVFSYQGNPTIDQNLSGGSELKEF